jgi:hypothetical protein
MYKVLKHRKRIRKVFFNIFTWADQNWQERVKKLGLEKVYFFLNSCGLSDVQGFDDMRDFRI